MQYFRFSLNYWSPANLLLIGKSRPSLYKVKQLQSPKLQIELDRYGRLRNEGKWECITNLAPTPYCIWWGSLKGWRKQRLGHQNQTRSPISLVGRRVKAFWADARIKAQFPETSHALLTTSQVRTDLHGGCEALGSYGIFFKKLCFSSIFVKDFQISFFAIIFEEKSSNKFVLYPIELSNFIFLFIILFFFKKFRSHSI